jgi:hypothetical protein
VGDGDPHSVIHPSLTHPRTPAEILESILARDEAPHSATSLLREQTDPALRLGLATQRYLDALHYAAEDVLRRQPAGTPTGVPTASAASEMRAGLVCNVVDALDHAAQRLAPGLSDEPAWPTLRARLLLLGANGHDPAALLTRAMAAGDLRTATLALPPFAVEVLRKRRQEQPTNERDAVFATRNGTWHQVGNIERRWRAIRADTGLDWVTPHTFRKTVATLIDRTVDSETAARVLGHSSADITKEYYIVRDRSTPDVTAVLEGFAGSTTRTQPSE